MTWRPTALLNEARANIGPRHLVLFVAFAVILAALGTLIGDQGQRAVDQEIASREAGALVWVVRANEHEALSVADCLNLASQDGVASTGGALVRQPAHELLAVPGLSVPTMLIVPGSLEVWTLGAPVGPAVGSDLESLGLATVGTVLVDPATRDASEIMQRVPPSVPVDRLRARVILPAAPVEPLSECWVRFDPSTASSGRDLLAHVFAGEDASISRHLVPPSELDGPTEQWRSATALQPWLVAGLLCAITGALLAFGRRQELAVYRTFGTSRSQIATIVSVETVIVLIPATLVATVASLLLAGALNRGTLMPGVTIAMAQQVAAASLVLLSLTPAATCLVIGGDLTAQLKDR